MSKTKSLVRKIKSSRNKCLVVTCIPCETPFPDKESPYGCANCGMLDWLSSFESEEECNRAFKKQYPREFDRKGNDIGN